MLLKIGDKIRREGLGYALQGILRRIPPGLLYANRFVIFALEVPSAPPAERAGIREAGLTDVPLLAINDCSAEFVRDRFNGGARVWVEEHEGRIIGHAWINAGGLTWDHCLKLVGAPGDTWSIDGWVAPEQRGKGRYKRIKSAAAFESGRSGHRRLLAVVDALNRNSIRANQAIGSRPIGRGFTLRLFGLTVVRIDGTTRAGFWSATNPLEVQFGPDGDDRSCIGTSDR